MVISSRFSKFRTIQRVKTDFGAFKCNAQMAWFGLTNTITLTIEVKNAKGENFLFKFVMKIRMQW